MHSEGYQLLGLLNYARQFVVDRESLIWFLFIIPPNQDFAVSLLPFIFLLHYECEVLIVLKKANLPAMSTAVLVLEELPSLQIPLADA